MSDLIDHDGWRENSMKVLDVPNSYNTSTNQCCICLLNYCYNHVKYIII